MITNSADSVLASCVLILLATYSLLSRVPPTPMHMTDRQRDDNAIADVVLNDLTTRDWIGLAHGEDVPRVVYGLSQPPDFLGDVDRPLRDSEDHSGVADRLDVKEAIQSLTLRHVQKETLSTYYPCHRRVRWVAPNERKGPTTYSEWYMWFVMTDFGMQLHRYWHSTPFARPYAADCPIELAVPGYSSNGKTAVIWIFCPEFRHSTYMTYVLERDGKRWCIVAAESNTYL